MPPTAAAVSNADDETAILPLERIVGVYSTNGNETCEKGAQKLGCCWAALGTVDKTKCAEDKISSQSKFEAGTVLEIPEKHDGWKVQSVDALGMRKGGGTEEDDVVQDNPKAYNGISASKRMKIERGIKCDVSVECFSDKEYSPEKNIVIDLIDSSGDNSSDSSLGQSGKLLQKEVPSPPQSQRSSESTMERTDSSPRRSGRDRKSTVVHINGHAVLAENNYVLKGASYSYGAYDVDKSNGKRPKKNKKGRTKEVVRVQSSAERLRMEHNSKVRSRAVEKEYERKVFMARNLDVLAPFLAEKVKTALRSFAHEMDEDEQLDWDVHVQPVQIQAEMRDYQLLGLRWMANMHRQGLPMILGDEMGLGKTLQTISLFCYLKEREGIDGPSLVICPLTVLYSWCNEIKKWAPGLKFLRFHSSDVKERNAQMDVFKQDPLQFDVIVTTYEMAKNPFLKGLWRRQYFNYLVLDEGHIIKESTTKIAEAVRKFHYENALILTGTPLQNNLVELWSILNFLYPAYFTAKKFFADSFNIAQNAVDAEMLHNAHEMLKLFMLRRMKVEVEKLLPKKIETKIVCPLSSMQIHWYKGLLLKDINLLSNASDSAQEKSKNGRSSTCYRELRNLCMQLRKCCIHPFLFNGAETDIDNTTMEDLIAASGKLAVMDKLLRSLYERDHRTVIFSQFTRVLDIIEDYCSSRGWKFSRFDGSTPRAKRNYLINKFNAPESDDFIFLMSTRSGGMGINLQTADTCILFDSDWNPQPDIQAQARVHRIGQTKTVHVYRLVTGGTVEERMIERAEKKLFLDQMVNRGAAAPIEEASSLTTDDLLDTLRFGSNAVFGDSFNGTNSLPTDAEIELITDRSRTEETSNGHLKGGATKTVKNFDALKELTSTTKLAGVDFKAVRDAQKNKNKKLPSSLKQIASHWEEENTLEGKRERKSRIVQVEGRGSGYGMSYVPVLAENNYDLEEGESSVFHRELKNEQSEIIKPPSTSREGHQHQDFCQVCGQEGPLLIQCHSCPVSVHENCPGLYSTSPARCSHHKCIMCGKKRSGAAGMLYPCSMCPNSYCEDCLPKKGIRLLGSNPRFEKLGFDTSFFCYIHCSKRCESMAKKRFDWAPKRNEKAICPTKVDVSYAFGKMKEV